LKSFFPYAKRSCHLQKQRKRPRIELNGDDDVNVIADEAAAAVTVKTTIQIQSQWTSNNSQEHECEQKSAKEESSRKGS
jgi:hypothetical protein